jgi:hypothetical protein
VQVELKSIARVLERLAASSQKGPLDYIQAGAVILTLCVLIWYTIETYLLRKAGQDQTAATAQLLKEAQRQNEVSASLLHEAQRQNEVAVMPILAIVIESPPGADKPQIALVNIGSGPAFNLSIDTVEWGRRKLQIDHHISVLRPAHRSELVFSFVERNSGNLLDVQTLSQWMKTSRLPDPLEVTVHCNSVSAIAYAFVFKCRYIAGKLRISYAGTASVEEHG